MRRAEKEAELEYKKSEEKIKKEIVDVSSMLAEKILDREIKEEDHHDFIESFIDNLGE
jgi:F-type H+-transporting ATPase subunit b